MANAGGTPGPTSTGDGQAAIPPAPPPAGPAPAPTGPPIVHQHGDGSPEGTGSDLERTVDAGGGGPIRLVMLGIVLLLLGFAVRWAQDVAAPYVNVGESELPGAVGFTAQAGTYRVITSGPLRPDIRFTVCEVERSDGETERKRGRDGVDGGHEKLGVTRVTKFDVPAGPTVIRCGRDTPTGDTAGRFQVVSADGPASIAVIALLATGAASLVGGIGWFLLRLRRLRN